MDSQFRDQRDEAVNEVLKKITYKPGTTFHFANGMLLIRLAMADACHEGHPVKPFPWDAEMDAVYWLAEEDLEAAVLELVGKQLVWNEMHEVGEWMRFQGERIYDPHRTRHEMVLPFSMPPARDYRV